MDFKNKRRICLIAGIAIEMFGGFVYAWSVVQAPLVAKYGWTLTSVSLAFTLSFITTMLVQLLAGKHISKLKPKYSIALGSLLYGGSLIACGFIQGNILELYLFFGIFNGASGAFIYPVLISYGIKLFPEKRGFGGGIMAAGFAFGGLLWAPITTFIFEKTGNISYSFIILGIIFVAVILVLSRFISDIPADFENEFETAEAKPKKGIFEKSRLEMIKSPFFYIIYLSLIAGLVSGLMIVTQGSAIVRSAFGMSAQNASVIVGLISMASAVGRLMWGLVSDKLGRQNVLLLVHLLMGLSMLLLLVIHAEVVYIALIILCGLCYGGYSTMVAPLTSDVFGTKSFGENYSVMFSAFAVSSVIGPPLIAALKEQSGGFNGAFTFGALFSLIGVLLSLLLIFGIRKNAGKTLKLPLQSPTPDPANLK